MPTLIGVTDARIDQKEIVSYQTNKIGGLPDWPVDDVSLCPQCAVCEEGLSLVVQLYCPLEGSIYHRTLYVFGCSNPPCWNRSESWIAIRCQLLDKQSGSDQSTTGTGDSTANAGGDDWGTMGEDWGVDADDWGADSGDWGDSKDLDSIAMIPVSEMEDTTAHISDDVDSQAGSEILENDVKLKESPQGDITDSLPMEDMCLDDVDVVNNDAVATSENPTSLIYAEDLPKDLPVNRLKAGHLLAGDTGRPRDLKKILLPHYIDVFNELTNQAEDNSHVTKLLKTYQKQEGIQSIEKCFSSEQPSGGAEKYEKTSLTHKDVVFHKFMKRVSACPQQCVRYEWGGSPLYISRASPTVPTHCEHCQGRLVFEVQLMPALVNSLKFPDYTGTPLEFGTVLVFTCEQSCWPEGTTYRSERLIVQADPDQDKFKMQ